MASGKRRKILIGTSLLLLGVILLLAIAPVWVPWLLRPALARFGVQIQDYQRIGYDRLALRGVTYTKRDVSFSADEVELHQPTVWLWRKMQGRFTSQDIMVTGWTLTISAKQQQGVTQPASAPKILESIDRTRVTLGQWVKTARLQAGTLNIRGEALSIPIALWDSGRLTAEVASPRFDHSASIVGALEQTPRKLHIGLPTLNSEATFHFSPKDDAVDVAGLVLWRTNRAQVTATFGWEKLLPESASIHSTNLVIPATTFRLEGYSDVAADFAAFWRSNAFTVSANAAASPTSTNLPPVAAILEASGDTNVVRVNRLLMSTPWLQASLSTNVAFSFTGKLLSPEATLQVAVDLSQQTMIAAKGKFKGDAYLRRSTSSVPDIEFDLESEGFTGYGIRLDAVQLDGTVRWPIVRMDTARIIFADGGVAVASAEYDAVEKELLKGELRLNGQIGHEFLPPELSYTNIALYTRFSGSIMNPQHSGDLEISGLRWSDKGPITAASKWNGQSRTLRSFAVEVKQGKSLLALTGSGHFSTNASEIHLKDAALQRAGGTVLRLEHPAEIRFHQDPDWIFQLDQLALGGLGNFALAGKFNWPEQGSFSMRGRDISLAPLQDFLGTNLTKISVNSISAEGSWSNSPVAFSTRASLTYRWQEDEEVLLQVAASTKGTGIDFSQISLLSRSGPILTGQGNLPLTIVPTNRSSSIVQNHPDAPFEITLQTHQNHEALEQIARLSKVRLEAPEANLHLRGSLSSPEGTLRFSAARAHWLGAQRTNIPPLTDITANLEFTKQRVRIRELSLRAEDQEIRVTAESPFEGNWAEGWKGFLDWRRASGRIFVDDAKVEAFAKYLPRLLVPQGNLTADVSFAPGPRFTGSIVLTNAATRPLPNSGPLHDVYARLSLAGQAVQLEEVKASLGGQPVSLLGRVDFATERPGNLPLIDIFLRGENVPLARRIDLILRSDLNLRLSNVTNAVPMISGNVRLRDSFFLGDLRQLVPGRVASPRRRPPYFSFEQEPYANWLLDVHVTGAEFLRARSPLFRGTLSANVRLSGPLKEPIAIGDTQIASGTVLFPFANFQVEQGWISLTSEDPYRPQIHVDGRSRAFGYDIDMTISGPVDRPVIEFSSTPPLTSEQIILMVTAGEVPRRGFAFTNQQRAQRLAVFVGRNILSRFSDTAGAERLSITTGEEISEQGRETYALEYRINDTWSIVGEYDRFGALNVGIKWRIYSR